MKGEKKLLSSALETQKQNFKLQLIQYEKQHEQKSATSANNLREEQKRQDAGAQLLREHISKLKSELAGSNFVVNEEKYIELKSKLEDHKTLKEFLQVKVYEIVEKYQKEIERTKAEALE